METGSTLKLPLTRYGLREIVLFGGALAALAVASAFLFWPLAIVFAVLAAWLVAFFRDPPRAAPVEAGVLVAPADGKVVSIERVHDDRLGGPCHRITIFLSIFNVHINRAPAPGEVVMVEYRPGRFLNALKRESSEQNEANLVVLSLSERRDARVGVRQISGAIARRIVCQARVGDNLCRGERYGMIKFGSRTELVLPETLSCRILATVGQKVRAGETLLAKLP